MAITISGENNNDRILAADGVIDQISGINFSGIITASHINVGDNIQLGNAGIITATTFVGNLTGNVNSTSPLLLQTGGSERFRITGNNELGIAGANYGTAGQVLTSGGSGSAVSWTTPAVQTNINNNANNRLITGSGTANTLEAEAALTFYNSGSDPILTLENSGNPQLRLRTTSTTDNCTIDFGDGDAVNRGRIVYTNTGDNMLFYTNGTSGGEKLKLYSDGRLNISHQQSIHADTMLHVQAPSSISSGETNVKFEGDTTTLGARLSLQNNNTAAGANNQLAFCDAGGQSTSTIIGYNTDQTNNYGELAFATRNAQGTPPEERLRITSGGDILTTGNTQLFGSNTSDGSDNKAIMINGGGAVSDSRGGYLLVHGNEHSSNPGVTRIHAGNVSNAYIAFNTGGNERLRIENGGAIKISSNSAKIRMGSSNQLELYHNGTYGYLNDTTSSGTELRIAGRVVRIMDNDSSHTIAYFSEDNTKFYTDNLERFHIDSGGTTLVNSIRQRSFGPNTGSTNQYYWKIGSTKLNGSEGFILTFCGTGGYSNGQQIAGTTKVVARCSNASTLVGYVTGESHGAHVNIEDVRWKHEGSNVFSIWAKVQHYAQISPFVDFFGGAAGGYWNPENTNTGSTSAPSGSTAFSEYAYKQIAGVNTIQYLSTQTYFLENIRMASGKGIDFSANSNATGMSSEILDDYEEGSWTPTVGGWNTFTPYSGSSYYAGWYVKIGGMVHCGWKIYIQHLTTPSSNPHVNIGGLPFATRSVAAGPIGNIRFDIAETGVTNNMWNYAGANATTIYLYKQTNGGNGANAINASQNYSNMWTMGTATYATDS